MPGNRTKCKVALIRLIAISIGLFFLNACTVSRKPAHLLINKESYCNPPISISWIDHAISHNIDSVLASNQVLSKKFSVPSIILMHALGILDEVIVVDSLKEDSANSIKILQLSQRINIKVLLANAEIGAVAAELDCEGQRIDQIVKYVESLNAKRTTRLTVASLLIGAATGVAGALVSNSNWNKGVAIGGGVAGAGLGIATLNPKGRKIELVHKRNLLRNVWLQENNHDIPSFLWFMLTEKRISNAGASSLLANLKHRWIKYQFDGNAENAGASVNFSEGGIYQADDLHNRSEMINQLQAEIRSFDQYINIFLKELSL